MTKRHHQVKVYLDDKEFGRLKRVASNSGLSQTAFLRLLLNGYIPQEKPPPEYYELLKEIRGACRNLNQLTMVANATGSIHMEHLIEMRDILLSELLKTREAVELPRKET